MRILIIGNIATGKTTLANKLSRLYDISLFHIDSIVHHDEINKKRTSKEQINIINKINRENREYIIEGVLRENLEFLCNLVDTILVIDLDKKILNKRIKLRYFKQKLGVLKSDYDVNSEMLNNMYSWMNNYNYERQNKIIKKYHSKVILLKSTKDIKKYLIAVEKDL